MRQPKSLDEAKQMIGAEKAKITSSISAIAGSRWLLAVLATFALAFGSHLLYAPGRLPPVGGLSLAQSGLPPSVDFGVAGEQARELRAAAERQNVAAEAEARLAEHAERIPLINAIGFGAALVLLLGNMWIMTKRRPLTRG